MGFEYWKAKSRDTSPAEKPDGDLFCMVMADPIKEREAALTKEALRKFPKGVPGLQDLYVQDRLAMEFPGKCPALTEAERAKLALLLLTRSKIGWQSTLGQLEREDEAIMNVVRFYPKMPDEIRKLAEQRESGRLKDLGNRGRTELSLEDNATLDAWLRLPDGTDKERAALEEKLVKWAKIERGDRITETPEEKAERLFPGTIDAQKIAVRQLKGEAITGDEQNFLTVWRMDRSPNVHQVPYSDTWRSDEWLATAAGGWIDPKAAASFFDTVQKAKLRELKRSKDSGAEPDTKVEDGVILDAYRQFSNSPRAFELYARKQMAPTADVGKWKTLNADENKELEAWKKSKNVWRASHEEYRRLKSMDPRKWTPEEGKEMLLLQGLVNQR